MKNTDTWNFAHSYCGRLWWKIGLFMSAGTIFAIMMIQCAILLISIYPVERELRKNFDKTGKRI